MAGKFKTSVLMFLFLFIRYQETLQPSLEHSVSKVEFNILYPTLSPTEPIFLPDELAARDEKQKVEKDRPKSKYVKMPPRVTISNVFKVHVISDCYVGNCLFDSVNVYIQPTNWFVKPEEASLESLTAALKQRTLGLIKIRDQAATMHRNFLTRIPTSWFSRMKGRLMAKVGSVCFMQPTVFQRPNASANIRMLRTHKQAKLQSLFESSERETFFASSRNSLSKNPKRIKLSDIITDKVEYSRSLQKAPQNLFGLCRMPRNNMLRRLAEKKFVLCLVVLRNGAHIVDSCKDLPVDDIHTMQAVYEIHRRLNDPSLQMLGYVPTTLPPDQPEIISAFVRTLQPPSPADTNDKASTDECVAHVSQHLTQIEKLHLIDLWRTAETNKPIISELVLRSMIKFAHFVTRDIAPANAPEHGFSLLKLANKWIRTCELIREFNTAVSSCTNPTFRTIYFPQYETKVVTLPKESLTDLLNQLKLILLIDIPAIHRLLLSGAYIFSWTLNPRNVLDDLTKEDISNHIEETQKLLNNFATEQLSDDNARATVGEYASKVLRKAKLIVTMDLSPTLQWSVVRTLLVVPFWLFAFGRHCGPADKHAAFKMGYGLCPYHMLPYFVEEATREALKQANLAGWAKGRISTAIKRLDVRTLPERAGKRANVFLEQHIKDLAISSPELFQLRRRKIYKVFPSSAAALKNDYSSVAQLTRSI